LYKIRILSLVKYGVVKVVKIAGRNEERRKRKENVVVIGPGHQ